MSEVYSDIDRDRVPIRSRRSARWCAHPVGVWEINADLAMDMSEAGWGCGAVIQDSGADFCNVVALGGVDEKDVIWVEAAAVLEGLNCLRLRLVWGQIVCMSRLILSSQFSISRPWRNLFSRLEQS